MQLELNWRRFRVNQLEIKQFSSKLKLKTNSVHMPYLKL